MDTELLVEQALMEPYLNDGRRLLQELERDGFDVSVALWARVGEDKEWRLYIASKEAETRDMTARRRVSAALRRLPSPRLSSSDVRVIGSSDPFATDAVKARGQHTGPDPYVFTGWRLGDRVCHLAYIYPPPPYRLTPIDVVARVVSLMTGRQPGRVVEPSLVTLQDGSTKKAVPVGLQLDAASQMVVKFIDATNAQEMTFHAADVVGID